MIVQGYSLKETMDCQDWTEVTVHKRVQKSTTAGGIGGKPAVSEAVAKARRLEAEDGPIKKSKVLSPESRQAIVQGRALNKWTQAQLNQMCSFPKNLISDIEAGRLTPTGAQLNTLSRVLNVVLKFA